MTSDRATLEGMDYFERLTLVAVVAFGLGFLSGVCYALAIWTRST